MSVPPRATYRIQFGEDFRFADARRVVPYLGRLGVSHLYASPLTRSRPGSSHGYDVVDPRVLEPTLGDPDDFEALVQELRRFEMGLILDFVPNHMGIGRDNPWWMDVLAWGRDSPHAAYFDIDWESSQPGLAGKVLLPVLGDHYGRVLEGGELRLGFGAEVGGFHVRYYDQRFPIDPRSYPSLLEQAALQAGQGYAATLRELAAGFAGALRRPRRRDRRRRVGEMKRALAGAAAEQPALADLVGRALRAFEGQEGDPVSWDPLHHLLEGQRYRLAYWRVSAFEINYRRFFDIDHLAGLRMENRELFRESHVLVRRMVENDAIDGIRLDHVDGLRDPAAYFRKLKAVVGELPVWVEKILAPGERLPPHWPVDGTTGYEFMAVVGGLFLDPGAERALTRVYDRFVGGAAAYAQVLLECKRLIMREVLASELNGLADALHRIARRERATRDLTLRGVSTALADVAARLPVYRTYVRAETGAREEDRQILGDAVRRARRWSRLIDTSVYGFLEEVLTLDRGAGEPRRGRRAEVVDAALRFQQYTGPVMAKAAEDTAFYRYLRLLSLNEVGGAPDRFGTSVDDFHRANVERLESRPRTLVTTSTHDHKRGEDVRARLHVLTEVPAEWGRRVRRWRRLNRRFTTRIEDVRAPSALHEYLLYQTLVGAWPFEISTPEVHGLAGFRDRIRRYVRKAAREAKDRTSWIAPDEEYERALDGFVERALDPGASGEFLADVADFVAGIAPTGAVNGLAQVLLKLTVPGVADLYQGTEYWDFSLVDPDNRRPVDYDGRLATLDAPEEPERLLAAWTDGRIKQFVIGRLLELRREDPALFISGTYEPLEADGRHGHRLVAFARREGARSLVVVAPRLVHGMIPPGGLPLPEGWGETAVNLPPGMRDSVVVDALTGARGRAEGDGRLPAVDLLPRLPVAVLLAGRGSGPVHAGA